MARGVDAAALLPKVSFVKVDDDSLSKPAGVGENMARGFGCEHVSLCLHLVSGDHARFHPDNDGSEFQRPEHYIRHSGKHTTHSEVRNSN